MNEILGAKTIPLLLCREVNRYVRKEREESHEKNHLKAMKHHFQARAVALGVFGTSLLVLPVFSEIWDTEECLFFDM